MNRILEAGAPDPDAAQVEFFFGVGEKMNLYKTDLKLATLVQTAADHGFMPEAIIRFFDAHLQSGRIERVS